MKCFVKDRTNCTWPLELVSTLAKIANVRWKHSCSKRFVDVDFNLGCRWAEACWSLSTCAWSYVANEVVSIRPNVSHLANLSSNA
jgi:hypothetical protein